MDPYLNPFSPGAGQRPPELAGRTKIIEEAIISLRRALAGRSFRPMLFLGLRGTGKTVLLNELANQARDLGFLVSRLEAPEKADLVKMLYPEVKKIMRSLSTVEPTKDLASRGMQAVKRFAANLKIEVGGVEISVEPHEAHGDSVDLETELPDLFESIGTVAKAAKKGWLLSLDEIQYLSEQDFSALIVSLHRIAQTNLPVVLIGAGLPQLARSAGEAKSYAERLFRYFDIGALDEVSAANAVRKPIEEARALIDDDALQSIVHGTHGYPFFLQQWAACAWDIAATKTITLTDAESAATEAIHILDEGFFRVRLDRLTKAEMKYCAAMAALGEGPYAAGKIAEVMGKEGNRLGPIRAAIIRKGMIYSTSYGFVDFTVPLFADFMRRQRENN